MLLRRVGKPSSETLFLLLSALVLFYNVGSGSLLPSDDCIYAQAARETVRNANLLEPLWLGKTMYEKGPVLFWLLGGSQYLLGENEAAVRIPGVLCGLLLIWTVLRISQKLGGSETASFIGAALVVASNLFFFNSRRPMTDIPAGAFGLLAAYFFVSKRSPVLTGAFLGLSALTKISGPLPALVAIILLQAFSSLRMKKTKLLVLCVAFLAVFLPWHVYMVLVHGQKFLHTYFGYHIFSRMLRPVVGESEPTYLAWLIEREGMLWIIAVFGFALSVIQSLRKNALAIASFGLWLGAAVPLAVSSTSLPHYLVACLPGYALSSTLLADKTLEFLRKSGSRIERLALGAILLIAGFQFYSNNFRDLVYPDYGRATKQICAEKNLVLRLEGTCDLHDPCVHWYCDKRVLFFAHDPVFFATLTDIPVLEGLVVPLDLKVMRNLAEKNGLLLMLPQSLSRIASFSSQYGFSTKPVLERPSRLLVEFAQTSE